jgi:hypothetical protein
MKTDSEQLTRCNQARREQDKKIDNMEDYLDSVESRFFLWRLVTVCVVGAYVMYRIALWCYGL